MVNSELQKSSIYGLVLETGIQHAEGRVRSKSLLEEMSLIGFIPYTDNYIFQMNLGLKVDLNEHLYVAPNLVKFSKKTPAYPVFKTVTKANGKEYEVNKDLYMDSILDELPLDKLNSKDFDFISYQFTGKDLLKLLKRNIFLKKFLEEQNFLTENEENTYKYIGRDENLELSCGIENKIAISNNFLCLCTYMNKITGLPSYTVLTSNDTIRVLSEDDKSQSTPPDLFAGLR